MSIGFAPHPPFGHLLPILWGEGTIDSAVLPSPRVRGEGARRADEGQKNWSTYQC